MSQQADQIRDRRRAFAAPGSPLDRAVRLLAVVLPALVGAVAATMLIAPLSPRGEVSFLLDRNKVATAEDRLRVDNAMYRGEDKRGRPFSLSAGEAVQASASVPVVRMQDLTARMLLSEGPAVLNAPAGRYAIDDQRVMVDGVVSFVAADGYRMTARNVAIDLPGRSLVGAGRVEGAVPAGTFSADTIRADLDARTLTLAGNARLNMVPGRLRMP
ncbi:MAG TPA: LPS export ABC transporter periplasmic protein LptC [Croceibacterium sp.]|nr:LPS export ABC transporter periplasmic protein LptC [Croceibacterium sp.]